MNVQDFLGEISVPSSDADAPAIHRVFKCFNLNLNCSFCIAFDLVDTLNSNDS